ncbi:ABC transporter permease [Marivirga tractuosa]|uniref:ABC transporter, permease protein, putative n=1 Tax=Marivirga tractuosa (strain ATCC 23168 / DSM 4126 / NBRC 15989 / NCIMB 1408 / VKM B-1430 / H-43) TaxID=643867 RepID=E4TME4_MARTH|nr:ABC transporter permease [Marivirga tractuosa]ADR22403.1 ABC transporter, permease protein, putative [Marivirga tractuosa DSM 4126]BDD16926.1 ABC transporter permease [Marivirga tractuosa]
MSKIGLVIKREFDSRVKKKSFLLATILVPLLFPAIIGGMLYFAIEESKNAEQQKVYVLDESGTINFENDKKYAFEELNINLEEAKTIFTESEAYALLYFPKFELANPEGITMYAKKNPSLQASSYFENQIESQIRDQKLKESGINEAELESLKTNISLSTINVSDTGEEKASSAGVAYGIAYAFSFLVYMFVLIYGTQIMQGVIEEKSSKIVEIIVSSVKPFQLMIGKVIGVASVGLLQFTIWVVLIFVLSSAVFSMFDLNPADMQTAQQSMSGMNGGSESQEMMENSKVGEILNIVYDIPYAYYISVFAFFFISGYLLYGALFAAVGSAVDNISDAQQFTMPITMPMIIGFLGTFMFVMPEPDGNVSFWLSIIPFTAPVAMMARVAFGVPAWELALSMGLMVVGFLFTIWMAGRIYRIGILMHGTKVNYKTLLKWVKTNS